MCTASWFEKEGGFELFFNRDERRTRLRADPPRLQSIGGAMLIAPTDGDAGGTWIAVNEHGLALALLNLWQSDGQLPPDGFRSRGLLVRDLASCTDGKSVHERLAVSGDEVYRGYTLLVLEPGRAPLGLRWDETKLAKFEPRAPLVSSSVDFELAKQHRRVSYGRLESSAANRRENYEAFHRSKEPMPGALAVCMQREDACTVSASHVDVTAGEVRFRYADGSPDITPFGEALVLGRTGPLSPANTSL
ncbi:MAG: hypothetical protein ACI8QS_000084 [Planctomycetota bacterium]